MRSKVRIIVIAFLSFFFFLCMSVLGISFFALQKLIYNKRQERYVRRAEHIRKNLVEKIGAHSITFQNRDGITLRGLFIERKKPVGTMILCHGYRNNKESLSRFVEIFPEYNLLFFDFRAHGQSDGTFTTIGCKEYRDIIASREWVRKKYHGRKRLSRLPLVIVGISMGGAATIKAAAKSPHIADAFIVDSAYADLWEITRDVFTRHSGLPEFPFLRVVELLFDLIARQNIRKMKPIAYVKNITKPLLFIHSCYDDHTHPENTFRLYEASDKTISSLWIGPKCYHAHLHRVYPHEYAAALRDFLSEKGVVTMK